MSVPGFLQEPDLLKHRPELMLIAADLENVWIRARTIWLRAAVLRHQKIQGRGDLVEDLRILKVAQDDFFP
jgi:hypothetical protein